jgi:hypothetical protein
MKFLAFFVTLCGQKSVLIRVHLWLKHRPEFFLAYDFYAEFLRFIQL